MLKVKILETDKRCGVKKGEVYTAVNYSYDPQAKVSLIGRVPDGYDPSCNQYKTDVAFWINSQWMVVVGGAFQPEIPGAK